MAGASAQTLRPFRWRARELYTDTEIVSRVPGGIERYGYETYDRRVAQLSNALESAGVEAGDRVATFCWNHHRHFESYFAVPDMGAQLHTINPLLPDHHIEYIVENATDRLLFVDPSLVEALEGPAESASFSSVDRFVVMGDAVPDTSLEPAVDYESFVGGQPEAYDWPDLPGDQPAGLCYTSGTTGKPKGVEYTQSMLWAHTMATLTPQGIPLADDDVVMPVVPMFHVNAWGLPFTATAAGAGQVFPGPAPDPADIASLIETEEVTISAGVPTVWLGLFEYLDDHAVDLSSLDTVIVGGSAAPEAMIRQFDELGVELLHAWGMTEMSPIGTVAHLKGDLRDADPATRTEKRTKQGLMMPGLEFEVVDEAGEPVPWNGEDFGELWVRGPWVTTEYFARPDATEAAFEDGFLKTGDIVTVDEDGYVQLVDRAKDVIKSGGEWISSVELENALMAHDDVAEATVIGVPHERWQERPMAFVVASGGVDEEALSGSLFELVEADYPTWWRPDEVRFVDEIPKTATGKFDKKALREEYRDASLVEGRAPEEAAPKQD